MTGAFTTRVPGLGLTYRSPFAGSSSISDGLGNTAMAAAAEETVLLADVQVGSERRPLRAG